MPISVHDAAAALRERLPSVRDETLDELLDHCQSHHLAAFGEPLFSEAPDRRAMDEGRLNTIGHVLSRYGSARTSSGDADEDETVVLDPARVSAWLAGAQDRRSAPSRPDDLAALRARLASIGSVLGASGEAARQRHGSEQRA